jgi:antitoxin (DNA-binding transcriptional repressor) of toxin-antitoxin stability system
MTSYVDVGAYEAKTHLSEFLRNVRNGVSYHISHRGEHIADLVPPGAEQKQGAALAAQKMQQFSQQGAEPTVAVDIKALIAEGRD